MTSPEKRKYSATEVASLTMARRSSRPAIARTVAAPTLDAYLDGPGREGVCGGFKRTRRWRLTNGRQGFVIQKVTRTFTVERFDSGAGAWTPISGAALDAYVTDPDSSVHATCTQYWELWKVREDGSVVHNEDSFALCSLIPNATTIVNTTKGSFTITGEAYFYATDSVTADDLGFATGAVRAAGTLHSRTSDPSGDLTANRLVASGAAVTYTVTSTWDSTTSDRAQSVIT